MPKNLTLSSLLLMIFMLSSGSAISCDRWEYARLKESTKKELLREYCYGRIFMDLEESSMTRAQEMFAIGIKFGEPQSKLKGYQAEIEAADNKYKVCRGQADDAANMLKKKFKIENPVCPKNNKESY